MKQMFISNSYNFVFNYEIIAFLFYICKSLYNLYFTTIKRAKCFTIHIYAFRIKLQLHILLYVFIKVQRYKNINIKIQFYNMFTSYFYNHCKNIIVLGITNTSEFAQIIYL